MIILLTTGVTTYHCLYRFITEQARRFSLLHCRVKGCNWDLISKVFLCCTLNRKIRFEFSASLWSFINAYVFKLLCQVTYFQRIFRTKGLEDGLPFFPLVRYPSQSQLRTVMSQRKRNKPAVKKVLHSCFIPSRCGNRRWDWKWGVCTNASQYWGIKRHVDVISNLGLGSFVFSPHLS